jgi:hypothetical protein
MLRIVIAAIVPQGTFLLESVSYVPEHHSQIPLEVVLAVLNSKLADWYFRMGSTNAMVAEYQFNNLPCPEFATVERPEDVRMRERSLRALAASEWDEVMAELSRGMAARPFSTAVRDVIVAIVRQINAIEAGRGTITRAQRSSLATNAQPYQDLIDRILYELAGLAANEVRELEERYANML